MTPTEPTVAVMKLLIISDLHANWPALRAVWEAESDAKKILCLGDLVDYGPEPARCVEWVLQHVSLAHLVKGNHDFAVGWNQRPECSPVYRQLADVTRKHAVKALDEDARHVLRELSPQRFFSVGGMKFAACHAVPSEPLFKYLPFSEKLWRSEVELEGRPDFLFVGHTHIPGELRIGRTLLVNPGSVGQPKDGDPRAAYAIWENGSVTLKRTTYDVEETIRAYEQTPFSPDDVAALSMVLRTGGKLPVLSAPIPR
jgi:putative phosphoesterase